MNLSAATLNSVLINHVKFNQKKIPSNLEGRRALIREMVQWNQNSNLQDRSIYSNIISKGRKEAQKCFGWPNGAAIAAIGTIISLPLQVKRKNLDDREEGELPTEADHYFLENMALLFILRPENCLEYIQREAFLRSRE